MKTNFNELIPELALWNDGSGINIDEWLSGVGNYAHAIGYTQLFWPDFFEHDGCIFRYDVDDCSYQNWLNNLQGNKTSVEIMINHLHIADLFPNEKLPSKEQVCFLGCNLKEMWEAKLNRNFSHLDTEVNFHQDDSFEIHEYYVTMFQRRATE